MKCNVTFKEVTTKTIEIEGEDIFDIQAKVLTIPVDEIDFEKNPDDYRVEIVKIKES